MAKKDKHPLVNGYKKMKEINQLFKEIASAYIFDTSGLTLLGTNEDLGHEKIAIIDPSAMEVLVPYASTLINSAEMFEFTKAARLTSLECSEGEITEVYNQRRPLSLSDKAHSASISLIPYSDNPHPFSSQDVFILNLSRKFFVYKDLRDPLALIRDIQTKPFLNDSVIDNLKHNEVVWVPSEAGFDIALSREIFPTISKCGLLRHMVVAKHDNVATVLFEEIYDNLVSIYTAMGYLDYNM